MGVWVRYYLVSAFIYWNIFVSSGILVFVILTCNCFLCFVPFILYFYSGPIAIASYVLYLLFYISIVGQLQYLR